VLTYVDDLIVQLNVFGEPAWTLDEDRQQFYYHAYSEDEPDLNLANPSVVAELDVSVLMLYLYSMIHVKQIVTITYE